METCEHDWSGKLVRPRFFEDGELHVKHVPTCAKCGLSKVMHHYLQGRAAAAGQFHLVVTVALRLDSMADANAAIGVLAYTAQVADAQALFAVNHLMDPSRPALARTVESHAPAIVRLAKEKWGL